MRSRPLLVVVVVLLGACGPGESDQEPVTNISVTTTMAPSTTSTLPGTTTTAPPAVNTTPLQIERYQIVEGRFDGPDRFTVAPGDVFEIEVVSDSGGELHVHGYDVLFDLEPGEPALVTFEASIPGVFEVELEASHTLLFEIEVSG